ncbi:MAG: hypothetical protein ACLPXT_15275 [Terracidiphilus sp.]
MENGWVKRNKWIFVVAPLALVLFIWIGGEVVMYLWNWLLPALFGVRAISFWQALGLLVLSRILFGRLNCGGNGHHKSDRKKMTPEEREKFRADMRSRWCGGKASAAEPEEQE